MTDQAFRKQVEGDKDRRRKQIKHVPEDGLVLSVLKLACIPALAWHRAIFCRVVVWLDPVATRVLNQLQRWLGDGVAPCAEPRFRMATDLYSLGWSVVLIVAYFATYSFIHSESESPLSAVLVVGLAALGVIRIYEVLCFMTGHFASHDPDDAPPVRAVLNTLWHYAEAVVAFGTLYMMAALITGDSFATPAHGCLNALIEHPGLIDHPVNAFYFSLVTITTLGYGEYHPEGSLGKTLVCVEVAVGLYMLMIILVRAMDLARKRCSAERQP